MKTIKAKNKKISRRKSRVRAKIKGTPERPRLSVFRSSRHTYAQLIDDQKGNTLVSASTFSLDKKLDKKKSKKQDLSFMLGELVAKKAAEKGIKAVIFDRGAYKYHGRVQAVAEGARKAGLNI